MTTIDTPVPEPFVVIGAFLDGEHVEAAALKQALSSADGRDYLIDVLALRQSAAGMGPVSFPSPAGQRQRSFTRWTTAAAIALVASGLGYVAGERTSSVNRSAELPRAVEAVIDLSVPAPAPEPTEVIRLRPGVNWSLSGEN